MNFPEDMGTDNTETYTKPPFIYDVYQIELIATFVPK